MEETRDLTLEELGELLQVRRDKLARLKEKGADPFEVLQYPQTHHSDEVLAQFVALEGKEVSVAGRMVSRRIMGKASFAHLLDVSGALQLYIKRDDVGEEAYEAFKSMDIGDLLGKRFKGQTVKSPMDFARMLLEDRCVAVVPGEAFEAPRHCRLSYATSLESIQRGMERIEDFIQSLEK